MFAAGKPRLPPFFWAEFEEKNTKGSEDPNCLSCLVLFYATSINLSFSQFSMTGMQYQFVNCWPTIGQQGKVCNMNNSADA